MPEWIEGKAPRQRLSRLICHLEYMHSRRDYPRLQGPTYEAHFKPRKPHLLQSSASATPDLARGRLPRAPGPTAR